MSRVSSYRAVDMTNRGEPQQVVQDAFERCSQAFCRYFTVRTSGDPHVADDLMQQLWLQGRLHAAELRNDRAEPWL